MADDLNVAIRIRTDSKQAVSELKATRLELAGLSTEAKNLATQMGSLGQGLRGSAYHAQFFSQGLAQVKTETLATKSALSSLGPELLALGKTIGVTFATHQVINFVREVGRAAIQLEKTQAVLKFATGSAVEAAKGYQFAADEANRLGLEVQSTAFAYARFAAGAKGAAFSSEEIKKIFIGVSEASRALGLSVSDVDRAFRALTQIIAKGKITAEEFRGQIGDALPGASRIAADALGVTTEEFSRMLDEGELTLDFLKKFGDALHQEFGVVAAEAAGGLAAELNRLSNEWEEMQLALAKGGGVAIAIETLKIFKGVIDSFSRVVPGKNIEDELIARQVKYENALKSVEAQRGARANRLPGAGAEPRALQTDIFQEAALRKAQNALEALQKSEETGHKKSLGRVSELSKARDAAAKERAQQEQDIKKFQQEAFNDNLEAIAEENKTFIDSLDVIGDKVKEITEQRDRLEKDAADERTRTLEREAEAQSRIITAPFENAIEGVQDSFTDAFESIFSGGVDTFGDLADTIGDIFTRLAAEVASLFAVQAFGSILASIAGVAGGKGTPGSPTFVGPLQPGQGGGLGGLVNILGGASSLSGALGGPSISSLASSGLSSLGASPGTISALGGFASTLGAAGLGAFAGTAISGALGANKTAGQVGVYGGAAIGAAFGPIGAAIGAVIGGLLSAIIQETPPRGFTTHEVGRGTLREGGKKGFDPSTFDPMTKAIDKSIVSLGKLLDINTTAAKYWIGFQEGKGFQTTIGGRGDVSFQKGEDVSRAIILEELGQRAETPFQRRALGRARQRPTLKGALESIGKDVSFKEEFETFVKEAGRPADAGKEAAKQLREMEREFKKMREHAKELGISLEGFKDAAKRSKDLVKEPFKAELEAFTKFGKARDIGAEMAALEKEFALMRKTAMKLGLSLEGFDEAAQRMREDLVASRRAEFEGLIGGTKDLPAQLRDLEKAFEQFRPQPGGKTLDQLGLTLAEFEEAKRKAKENLIGGFTDAFEEFKRFGRPRELGLELARLEEEFAEMRDTARDLGLNLDGFDDAARRARESLITDFGVTTLGQIQSNLDQLGITGLQGFRRELDIAPDLAPIERFGNIMKEFEETRAAAAGGDIDAIRRLPEIARLALEAHREVYANAPETARFREELKALLDGLVGSLTPGGLSWEELAATMREVGRAQIAELKLQTELLLEQLAIWRRMNHWQPGDPLRFGGGEQWIPRGLGPPLRTAL